MKLGRLSPALLFVVSALLACSTLAGPTATPPPTAAPIPNVTMIYYDLMGVSEEDLVAQLKTLMPTDSQTHEKFHAVTHSEMKWNWPGYATPTCRLDEARVTYQITVTFPRWQPPLEASPFLIAKWNKYTQALAAHEQEHVSYALQAYDQVVAVLKNATCTNAEEKSQEVLTELRQRNQEYDDRTDHGGTQGARFP